MYRVESGWKTQLGSVWSAGSNTLCIVPSPPCLTVMCAHLNTQTLTGTDFFYFSYRLNGPLHLHAKRSGAKRNETERVRCKRVLGGLFVLNLHSPLSSRARQSLPLRRRSTSAARRRRATWRLR